MRYLMVGIQPDFQYVKEACRKVILEGIEKGEVDQLRYLIRFSLDDVQQAFAAYQKEWPHVCSNGTEFQYRLGDDLVYEARLTAYGMETNAIENNPMARWFMYCHEDWLVIEREEGLQILEKKGNI